MRCIFCFQIWDRGAAQIFLLTLAIFFATVLSALSQDLPDGDGKEITAKACKVCHGLNRLTRPFGHDPDEWQMVVERMTIYGAPLTKDQVPVVTEYLSKSFPNKAPKPVLIPGSVEVSINEWALPKAGTFPHDPLYAKDGSVWYSGLVGNVLGRFDPKTQQFKEYKLKTPRSSPHGLTDDKDGNIWFTANSSNYIGKLDPKTGEIIEYPLSVKGPHTPILDQKGNLWFTYGQQASVIGRLVMKTSDIKLIDVPTPDSGPYGIVINSKGVPFFAESRSNKVASIDPDTLEIHEYPVPNPQARPRRIAITPDDVIYYTDFAKGTLGRLDPKTGKITVWPSPGGPDSAPYAITAVNNVVWYSESGVRPNTVVRFDPKTEQFQTWAIPSGGGVVRNMSPTPDGDIWIACSHFNKIGVVRVTKTTRGSTLRLGPIGSSSKTGDRRFAM
jgi:virginiamycin B lyase